MTKWIYLFTLCFSASISVVHANLINQWSLDEGSGTAVTDSISANNGVFTPGDASGPQWETLNLPPVPSGSTAAVDFDGTADHLAMTTYKGITGTGARSMSAWIRTRNTGAVQNMSIISWGTNTAEQKWNFRVQSGNGTPGTIRVEVNGGYIVGNALVTDGNWHHVAATWEDDGSPNVNDVRLYVDGLLDAQVGSAMVPSAVLARAVNTAPGTDVRIGEDFSGRVWNGWLDEVRVYDHALSGSEVLALAIPEPSGLGLVCLGLGLTLGMRRRFQ